eukprot:1376781-Pyramimonas_sp.AAC.1
MSKVRPSSDDTPFDAQASPFVEMDSPFDLGERVKMVLLFPLAILRIVLLLSVGVVAFSFSRIAMLGLRDDEPLESWRRGVPPFYTSYPSTRSALAQSCIHTAARAALLVLGFWHIRVSGKENVKEAEKLRAVVVINHISYLDGFL